MRTGSVMNSWAENSLGRHKRVQVVRDTNTSGDLGISISMQTFLTSSIHQHEQSCVVAASPVQLLQFYFLRQLRVDSYCSLA
jgi:hypothetical protein